MRLAYMAHPLGPDGAEREKNRQNATKWFAWLHDHFPSIAFTANWVLLSAGWPETDEHRKRGLEIDMVHVERSDLIFYVGGRMSEGMIAEQSRAAKKGLHQVDLTFLGYGPPASPYHIVGGIENGYFKALDSALARIAPLDPEQRAAFDKKLSERLSLAAMAHTMSITNPIRPAQVPPCTAEDPCSWCKGKDLTPGSCVAALEGLSRSGLDPDRAKGGAG